MHFTYAFKGGFSFFVSTKGYMGLTGSKAQYDDDLCIVFGGSVPFVLRKDANGYKLISDAYVHGLMNGEAIRLETKIEKINII
jgi:hypothetical protein